MDRISGLTALLETLRRKVDGKGSVRNAGPPAQQTSGSAAQAVQSTRSLAALERSLRARLRQVARDALSSEGTKRMVVSALLSWQFDERLQNEPKFNALVTRVQRAIDADAELRGKFERVIAELSG